MGNFEHGYKVPTDSPVCEGEKTKLFEGCFILDMPKPFIGGKGREGSFQVKQHPTGFVGSTDDIIFSTGPGV